jgi:rod shape-determining protein MreC
MQKLIQFLKKFRDFFIFFILQVFVLTLFFNSKAYHRSKMVNTSSGIVGWFLEKKHNITKHFDLEEANEALLEHNAALLAQQPESFYQLQQDVFRVNDTLKKQHFKYIPATVINATSNDSRNYFTLNKGLAQGVYPDMGVISDHGVIGRVIDASDHFSIVMTALSIDSKITVKHESNNEFWFLTWEAYEGNFGIIHNVKRDIAFEVGDKVVTRGGDLIFPTGVPVGTIHEVISEDGSQTISLSIDLAVNYNAVYHVYVVENLMKNEQEQLEQNALNGE